jgi:hypothetical protein
VQSNKVYWRFKFAEGATFWADEMRDNAWEDYYTTIEYNGSKYDTMVKAIRNIKQKLMRQCGVPAVYINFYESDLVITEVSKHE